MLFSRVVLQFLHSLFFSFATYFQLVGYHIIYDFIELNGLFDTKKLKIFDLVENSL